VAQSLVRSKSFPMAVTVNIPDELAGAATLPQAQSFDPCSSKRKPQRQLSYASVHGGASDDAEGRR
jgi:hypothetical protein